MKKVIEITDSNFNEVISTDKVVLIDFWASWCGPCKMIAPIIEQLSEEYDDKAIIGKVDVDANPNSSVEHGIKSIPTLLFFKNGKVIDKEIGVVSKAALVDKLNSYVS